MLERASMLAPPAYGEANRCPHCNAIADVEPHAALGFACRVCGGPRVPLDGARVAPSEGTRRALIEAKQQHRHHLLFSGAGLLLGGAGALGLVVALLVVLAASPGLLVSLFGFMASAAPLLAGLLALSRAARARASRRTALHAAQLGALRDVQADTGELDAARAAEMLRISPDQAELLLAEASVAAMLEPLPVPKLRIEGPAATVLDDELEEPAPRTEKLRAKTELEE